MKYNQFSFRFILWVFVLFFLLIGNAFSHVEEPHEEESESPSNSISIGLFLLMNLTILILSMSLLFIINKHQQNMKLISPRVGAIVIVTTLFINAIIAMNTYVEVK